MRYARIVFTEYKPGTFDSLNRKCEQTLVPRLREIPGFVSYQVDKVDDRSLVSYAITESREAAELADRTGKEWMRTVGKDEIVSTRSFIAEIRLEAQALPMEVHPAL